MAYDIVKAHGGEIKVQTKEGGRERVYNSVASCLNVDFSSSYNQQDMSSHLIPGNHGNPINQGSDNSVS